MILEEKELIPKGGTYKKGIIINFSVTLLFNYETIPEIHQKTPLEIYMAYYQNRSTVLL